MSCQVLSLSLKMDQINVVNESETKKFDRKYVIPKVVTKFPVSRNKLEDIAENKDWIQWLFKFSMMSTDQFKKIQGIGLYVYLYYPFCSDKKRMEILFKTVVMFFIIDDHTECSDGQIARNLNEANRIWGQFGQIFEKLEGNKEVTMIHWEPYIFSFYSTLEVQYRSYNDIQKKRFIKEWRRYIEGNLEETEFIAQGKIHESVEGMNKIRFKSGAGMIMIQNIEYADQIFVPEHVWEEPRMQKLMELASLHFTQSNDLFSFEKEEKDNKDLNQLFNLVAVLSVTEGLSIEESMKSVAKMIPILEEEIRKLEDEILEDENCLDVTRLFIDRINFAIGANFTVQSLVDRYNKIY